MNVRTFHELDGLVLPNARSNIKPNGIQDELFGDLLESPNSGFNDGISSADSSIGSTYSSSSMSSGGYSVMSNSLPVTNFPQTYNFNIQNNGSLTNSTEWKVDATVRHKKSQVPRACVYCQRLKRPCDIQRPCRRCCAAKIADTCRDAPRKIRPKGIKRGPYQTRKKKLEALQSIISSPATTLSSINDEDVLSKHQMYAALDGCSKPQFHLQPFTKISQSNLPAQIFTENNTQLHNFYPNYLLDQNLVAQNTLKWQNREPSPHQVHNTSCEQQWIASQKKQQMIVNSTPFNALPENSSLREIVVRPPRVWPQYIPEPALFNEGETHNQRIQTESPAMPQSVPFLPIDNMQYRCPTQHHQLDFSLMPQQLEHYGLPPQNQFIANGQHFSPAQIHNQIRASYYQENLDCSFDHIDEFQQQHQQQKQQM